MSLKLKNGLLGKDLLITLKKSKLAILIDNFACPKGDFLAAACPNGRLAGSWISPWSYLPRSCQAEHIWLANHFCWALSHMHPLNHSLSQQQGVRVSSWHPSGPNLQKSPLRTSKFFGVWNVNFIYSTSIQLALNEDIMPYFNKLMHIHGCNLSEYCIYCDACAGNYNPYGFLPVSIQIRIQIPPLKNRMPKYI